MPLSYKALLKGTQLIAVRSAAGSLALLEMQFSQLPFGVHVTNNTIAKEKKKKNNRKKNPLQSQPFI